MEVNQNSIINAATVLKSVGHPIRIKIIIALTQKSMLTVTELSDFLSINQPIISLHLAILRKQKVIQVKKDGKQSIYSILDNSVQQMVALAYHTRL